MQRLNPAGFSNPDGFALPLVLAALAILSLVAVTAAAQVRAEIRTVQLQPQVQHGQHLVRAAVLEAVRQAQRHPNLAVDAPDPARSPEEQGFQPCQPVPISPADPNGPAYCFDLLRSAVRMVALPKNTAPHTLVYQARTTIPVSVRWQSNSAGEVQTGFAWLLIDEAGKVTAYHAHHWCRPAPRSEPHARFCEIGS